MSDKARLLAKISAGALALVTALVMAWEGYRSRVYADPVGRLTVCYGHTDPSLHEGALYTRQECRALLDADLLANARVLDCVDQSVREGLSDGQQAALVSFAFNVGVDKACASTFVRRINGGEGRAACPELSRWIYAGGRVLPGLIGRRAAERAMCEAP